MVKFIRDSWRNNSNSIVDENSQFSNDLRNLSLKLNQASGYINFNSTNSGFYSVIENESIIPSAVSIASTAIGDSVSDFRLEISINDVLVGTHFYGIGETSKNSTNNVSNLNITNSDNNIVKLQCFGSGGPDSFKISTIDISYSGISLNNSYNSPTPEIKSIYPSSIVGNSVVNNSGGYDLNPAFINGPTNASGNDHTYIYKDFDDFSYNGIFYDENDISIGFNTSGYFTQSNTTRHIDRAIFSIRYHNLSGYTTNIQNFCGVTLTNDFGTIGYGSGFHLVENGGFTRVETDIYFLDGNLPSKKYANTNLISESDGLNLKLTNIPINTRISSAQLDLYLSNDDMLCMNLPGAVYHKRKVDDPYDVNLFNTGHNRIKGINYDSAIFSTVYRDMDIGNSLNKNFSTPDFWKNYHEEQIDTYNYHNHNYKNSLYLKSNQYLYESFNSTNSFSILFHCSTSGNNAYLDGINHANILSKYNTSNQPEFLLNINNDQLEFVTYNTAGAASSTLFDSKANNFILITKSGGALSDNITVYFSEADGDLYQVASHTRKLRAGNGLVYFGGSGLTDFNGYVHEYGINTNFMNTNDILNFTKSRHRLSSLLSIGSGIEFTASSISGNINDSFEVFFPPASVFDTNLYQLHTPMIFAYNTLLTNPSAVTLLMNYENTTNNPSGMTFSGYYINGIYPNSEEVTVGFSKNFTTSSGTIEIGPISYASSYGYQNQKLSDYRYLKGYLNSPNNQNHSHNFKIRSLEISFDGWYLPITGYIDVDFVTAGHLSTSDNFDMYLQNTSIRSGVDFYIQGHEASNDYINFHILGTILEQSGLSMYMIGQQVGYNDLDFLVQGPLSYPGSLPEGTINFLINGTVPSVSSGLFDLFVNGLNQSGLYNIVNFSMISELDPDSGIVIASSYDVLEGDTVILTFYDDGLTNGLNFYIGSSLEETEDSINFSIPGTYEKQSMFNMFMFNQHSGVDYELDFSMYSAYNMSGQLNMVI